MNSETAKAGPKRHRAAKLAVTAAALATGLAASVAALPSTAGASSGATVKLVSRGSLGKILVNGAGKTLYRFTQDRPNKATCTGGCAGLWPPLLIAKGTKPTGGAGVTGLGTVPSGTKLQVTFKKHPLYTYALDSGPGSTSGQGVGGTWFVVTSSTKAATTAASSGASKSKGPSGSGSPSGGYGY
jgi:predicted lipoprotein with Yx(FWY)xxD motif